MRKTLWITDLTQMQLDRVCIAGLDENGMCTRPVLLGGVHDYHLSREGEVIIRTRARVRFQLTRCPVEPPHIEDWLFNRGTTVQEGICGDPEWETVLRKGAFVSVESIFDGHLQERRWVLPGSPTRSLGTVPGFQIERVTLGEYQASATYRLLFRDGAGAPYDLSITDLSFRKFSDLETKREGNRFRAAQKITQLLQGVPVYLRLGLTRPYSPQGRQPVCWLQVTGIHTFPDYLEGKSFADL